MTRNRVTRAGPVGLDALDRVTDDDAPSGVGAPTGGGEVAGLAPEGVVGAGMGVGVGALAVGRGTGTGVGAGGSLGAGGGGGSGTGAGEGGAGRVTVGTETVIGGRPTWPSARAESTPAVAAAQETASVRTRVDRRIKPSPPEREFSAGRYALLLRRSGV
jgi:hypothetical protein